MSKIKTFQKSVDFNKDTASFAKNILYFIILCVFLLPVFYIAVKAVNLEEAYTLSALITGKKLYVYMMFGVLAGILGIYGIYNLILRISEDAKSAKILPYIILVLICGIQIAFVLFQKSHLRYDTLKIFDQALWIARGNEISPTYSDGYFAIYPNNIPLCIVTALLIKPAVFFGMDQSFLMLYVQIINCLMMSLAYLFTYKTLERLFVKSGLLFLIICLFNPMSYMLAPFYYTHTFSMFFSTGVIYLFTVLVHNFRKNEGDTGKRNIITAILMGILLVIGTKIRATVGIVAIAAVIYIILNIKNIMCNSQRIKGFLKLTAGVIVGSIAALLIYTSIQNVYVKYDYKETGYPASHWVMLGLSPTAGFNAADNEATWNLPTKEARNANAVAEIKSRINSMGLSGLITHGKYKMRLTWSDGVDDFIDNISATAIGSAKDDLISGQKNDMLVAYSHIYSSMLFISILILTIISIGIMLCKFIKKGQFAKKDEKSVVFIFILNLLGGILFHLLWEAGQVYSISFMCSVMALAALGIIEIFEKLKVFAEKVQKSENILIKQKRMPVVMLMSSLCIMAIMTFYTYNKLAGQEITHYALAVKQDLSELTQLDKPLLKDTYTQSFTVDRPFNTFGVKVYNEIGSENCSLYKITIWSKDGTKLTEQEILGANTFDNDFYTIEFPVIVPEKRTEYQVTITPEIVSEVHSLRFGVYDTGNYDLYENGKLYINGEATDRDLAFKVMNKYQGNYWE